MTVGTTQLAPSNGHNYIINGAFDFWQRGTSFSSNVYTADRWRLNLSGATGTLTQEAFTAGEIEAIGFGDAKYYCRVQSTVADNNTGIIQRIEDARTLAGQTATLSFWVKTDTTRTLRAYFDVVYDGSPSSVATYQSFTSTNSWQRISLTYNFPSAAGKTIGENSNLALVIYNAATETFIMDIWGVQLEAGSIATPFKRNANSIQGELAACQRYYQRIGVDNNLSFARAGVTTSTDDGQSGMNFITSMRTAPTISLSGTMRSVGSVTRSPLDSVSFPAIGKESARIDFTETGAYNAGEAVLLNLNPGAYVELDAEL